MFREQPENFPLCLNYLACESVTYNVRSLVGWAVFDLVEPINPNLLLTRKYEIVFIG